MKQLNTAELIKAAKAFCQKESGVFCKELFAVTDGKAVGTYIEHKFKDYLSATYNNIEAGNSAKGLDLPAINTDIKTTSIKQPQSSCPYQRSEQKIYGLGYNLIIFVYNKTDNVETKESALQFVSCTYVSAERTADYQTTTGINEIINRSGNADDIFAFLADRNIPADDVSLMNLAEKILTNPPKIGYLTISNALQWRLQYGRIIHLETNVEGITPIIKCHEK